MKLSACAVKAEYPDVFQGLGRLKDSYSIEIDESVRPVVHAPRRVPVPVREKVRKKLDELESDGVLTPVTEATDWLSSMVIVQKTSGQIRICLHPKDLNTAIRHEYYPMPTIEEINTRLKNAILFTALDTKNGFWQIPLDEKSSMLTCFNTPVCRNRWLRVPFGINSALMRFVRGNSAFEIRFSSRHLVAHWYFFLLLCLFLLFFKCEPNLL